MLKHGIAGLMMVVNTFFCLGQQKDIELDILQNELDEIEKAKLELLEKIELLKLNTITEKLEASGLPSSDYIKHSGFFVSYNEVHEQANWVAHVISGNIASGSLGRSNDFRVDEKVLTGTANSDDYFETIIVDDSVTDYKGYGYDRGHLAPSADFRWSAIATSESYLYSNMSPMVPEFNRGIWAQIESLLRDYVINEKLSELYVVTAPVLTDGLNKIPQSPNKVSVPETFIKVAFDPVNRRGIAFVVDNKKALLPLEAYVKSIDEAEMLSGYDYFNKMTTEEEETSVEVNQWFSKESEGDVVPFHPLSLPRGFFNSVQARLYMGERDEITVCGHVVGQRFTGSGNFWLDIDKRRPNQIFSVFIKKNDFVHFAVPLKSYFKAKAFCFTGAILNLGGIPTLKLTKEKLVVPYDE